MIKIEEDHEFIERCFVNALVEVMRISAGLGVCEAENNMEQNEIKAGQISGIMFLSGRKNAVLSITMPYDAAATLISYMTGLLPEEIEKEDICDGIAELTNVIAGRAKADLAGTDYHFSIAPPFSIAGEDYSIIYKNKVSRIYKKFVSEDMEILLEIAYI